MNPLIGHVSAEGYAATMAALDHANKARRRLLAHRAMLRVKSLAREVENCHDRLRGSP